jgi:hypothetical protein
MFLLISVCTSYGAARASDFGWLQPGVRVWYHGNVDTVGDGAPSTTIQQANLFEFVSPSVCTLKIHEAAAGWSSGLTSRTAILPSPYQEGPFWCRPDLLSLVVSGQPFFWRERQYVAQRGPATLAEMGVFAKASEPIRALFGASTREMVVLSASWMEGGSIHTEEVRLDVLTGILLTQWQQEVGLATIEVHLVMAEINYDFDAHALFAEDAGPHVGFNGQYIAGTTGPYDIDGYEIQTWVSSRYIKHLYTTASFTLNSTAWSSPISIGRHYRLLGEMSSVLESSDAGSSWFPSGDHLFLWVPPDHIIHSNALRVGDGIYERTSVNPPTYTRSFIPPSGIYIGVVAFNANGYPSDIMMRDFYLNYYSDSRIFGARFFWQLTGPSFYAATMGQATPAARPMVAITEPSTFASETNNRVAITIVRSGSMAAPASVNYRTVDGSAVSGSDFIAATGVAAFASGQLSTSVVIQLINDCVNEEQESFLLIISGATGAELGATQAVVFIAASSTCSGDANDNGVSDEWELLHFGNLTWCTRFSDWDQDRFCDRDEFLAGTIPTNGQSFLGMKPSAMGIATNGIVVRWQTVTGKWYQLDRSSQLSVGFSGILDHIAGQLDSTAVTDTTVNVNQPAFYRVHVRVE